MMVEKQKPFMNSGQYVTLAILSLAAVGLAVGMLQLGSEAFARFLGPVHPVIAIALGTLAAWPSLRYLTRRHRFAVAASGKTLRGVAAAAGMASMFAAAVIAVDLGLRYPETINVSFPQSLLFYPAIGYIVELLLHVTLLAIVLLLLRPLIRRPRENALVWLGIVLVALVEPVLQVAWADSLSGTELYTAFSVFLFSVTQMAIFRRYGFVPMVAMRMSFYLLWHIAWGYVRLGLLF